ncbi:hypothetical protein EI94DRAFT_1698493 [Lactarius quietus]|nr:hypothetical protein EI94DRAFT_1698493 [Lactarius quietus]
MHIKWIKEQRVNFSTNRQTRQSDLDHSIHNHILATQCHNEEILDQAYCTSKNGFLIFSDGRTSLTGRIWEPSASTTEFHPPLESLSSAGSSRLHHQMILAQNGGCQSDDAGGTPDVGRNDMGID